MKESREFQGQKYYKTRIPYSENMVWLTAEEIQKLEQRPLFTVGFTLNETRLISARHKIIEGLEA